MNDITNDYLSVLKESEEKEKGLVPAKKEVEKKGRRGFFGDLFKKGAEGAGKKVALDMAINTAASEIGKGIAKAATDLVVPAEKTPAATTTSSQSKPIPNVVSTWDAPLQNLRQEMITGGDYREEVSFKNYSVANLKKFFYAANEYSETLQQMSYTPSSDKKSYTAVYGDYTLGVSQPPNVIVTIQASKNSFKFEYVDNTSYHKIQASGSSLDELLYYLNESGLTYIPDPDMIDAEQADSDDGWGDLDEEEDMQEKTNYSIHSQMTEDYLSVIKPKTKEENLLEQIGNFLDEEYPTEARSWFDITGDTEDDRPEPEKPSDDHRDYMSQKKNAPSCWGCGHDYLKRWRPKDLATGWLNSDTDERMDDPICPDCYGEAGVMEATDPELDMNEELPPVDDEEESVKDTEMEEVPEQEEEEPEPEDILKDMGWKKGSGGVYKNNKQFKGVELKLNSKGEWKFTGAKFETLQSFLSGPASEEEEEMPELDNLDHVEERKKAPKFKEIDLTNPEGEEDLSEYNESDEESTNNHERYISLLQKYGYQDRAISVDRDDAYDVQPGYRYFGNGYSSKHDDHQYYATLKPNDNWELQRRNDSFPVEGNGFDEFSRHLNRMHGK